MAQLSARIPQPCWVTVRRVDALRCAPQSESRSHASTMATWLCRSTSSQMVSSLTGEGSAASPRRRTWHDSTFSSSSYAPCSPTHWQGGSSQSRGSRGGVAPVPRGEWWLHSASVGPTLYTAQLSAAHLCRRSGGASGAARPSAPAQLLHSHASERAAEARTDRMAVQRVRSSVQWSALSGAGPRSSAGSSGRSPHSIKLGCPLSSCGSVVGVSTPHRQRLLPPVTQAYAGPCSPAARRQREAQRPRVARLASLCHCAELPDASSRLLSDGHFEWMRRGKRKRGDAEQAADEASTRSSLCSSDSFPSLPQWKSDAAPLWPSVTESEIEDGFPVAEPSSPFLPCSSASSPSTPISAYSSATPTSLAPTHASLSTPSSSPSSPPSSWHSLSPASSRSSAPSPSPSSLSFCRHFGRLELWLHESSERLHRVGAELHSSRVMPATAEVGPGGGSKSKPPAAAARPALASSASRSTPTLSSPSFSSVIAASSTSAASPSTPATAPAAPSPSTALSHQSHPHASSPPSHLPPR